jgi:hypothetical protein
VQENEAVYVFNDALTFFWSSENAAPRFPWQTIHHSNHATLLESFKGAGDK